MNNRHCFFLALAALLFALPCSVSAGDPVNLYAAGSLKDALGEVASSYSEQYHIEVSAKFGPSGLLKKAIEAGERPDIFASANMNHPEQLAAAGWGSPVVLFTRNELCGLAQPHIKLTADNFLSTIKDAKVKLGTSTPKADPSGDYAWELFEKAETVEKGSFASLSNKALQLTGGPESNKAPEGRNQYAWVMEEKQADVFLTYCTNAVAVQKENSDLHVTPIPEALAVGADYGLIVRGDADPAAWQFALYILSGAGQDILKKYGFEAVTLQKN